MASAGTATAALAFLPRRISRGATDPAGVTEEHLPGPKTGGFWMGRSRFLHHDRASVAGFVG